MKYRTLIVLTVFCACLTVPLWLILRRNTSAPQPWHRSITTKQEAAQEAPPLNPNAGRMITITGAAVEPHDSVSNPPKTAWNDIQVILDHSRENRLRAEAIERLPRQMSSLSWQALKRFLVTRDASDAEQVTQVLKNQLMDALCAMRPPPSDLGDTLIAIYRNPEENVVIRDYAIQHLAALDQQLVENDNPWARLERSSAQAVLWEALGETQNSIAGTALLGLTRLIEDDPQIDRARLEKAVLKLTGDITVGELSRITAYQVCGQLNLKEALPTIESAAQQSPTIPTQISAIGALGVLGTPQDASLLENLRNDDRLKLPVEHALQMIAARQNR